MLFLGRYSPVGMGGAALLLAMLLTTGCEEGVNPVLGTERAYTVYGFFNAEADTQAMRIFAIEGTLALTKPEPLDARVVSIDRQTGDGQAWQDSIVQFENERFGHVYWSEFRAAYEHHYRLEVTRSDGSMTSAEVTVPPFTEPRLLTPTVAERFVLLPVFWPRAPRANNIRARYLTTCGVFEYRYPLDQEQANGGTVVTIQFSEDARLVFRGLIERRCTFQELRVEAVELSVLVSNAEWTPPTGIYDPDLLVEPGTFSNVENGFGFVGAGYGSTFRYEPPDSVLLAAGFFIDADDGGG